MTGGGHHGAGGSGSSQQRLMAHLRPPPQIAIPASTSTGSSSQGAGTSPSELPSCTSFRPVLPAPGFYSPKPTSSSTAADTTAALLLHQLLPATTGSQHSAPLVVCPIAKRLGTGRWLGGVAPPVRQAGMYP